MNKSNNIKQYYDYQGQRIPLYSSQAIEKMEIACKLAAETLDYITPFVKEHISTNQLDLLCQEFIKSHGAIAAPLNYRGYPKSTCISINHVICHGIPSDKVLRNGDILNIDVTVIKDGWYGDTSRMFVVGKTSMVAQKLIDVTYQCLVDGIAQVKEGATLGDIGFAIETLAHKNGFSVVEEFCGHGIGDSFHQHPYVMHFGKPGTGIVLKEGMVFTIEPMINVGKKDIKILQDGWTAVTKDGSLSAQFEHQVAVTKSGCKVLTLSQKQYTKPPYS